MPGVVPAAAALALLRSRETFDLPAPGAAKFGPLDARLSPLDATMNSTMTQRALRRPSLPSSPSPLDRSSDLLSRLGTAARTFDTQQPLSVVALVQTPSAASAGAATASSSRAMAFFLPSLRASSSSSSSTSASCCSLAPLSRRTVIHHPRLANPPKYKTKLHPAAFEAPLEESSPGAADGGATFVFNPAPSLASPRSVASLEPNLSPNGRRMPSGWAKTPGFGFMAPRIDRLVDGSVEASQAGHRPKAPSGKDKAEMARLREEDPVKNSINQLAKRYVLSGERPEANQRARARAKCST